MKTPLFDPSSRATGPAAVVLLLTVAGLERPANAQTILRQWSGTNQTVPYGDSFGCSFAGVGDVNGDGVPDVAVGASSTLVGSVSTGRLYVFSGSDGSTLFTLDGTTAFEGLAFRVEAVGDMDRDGHADILVWSSDVLPNVPGFRLVSGSTGTIIGSYADYVSAAGVGDVDSDGWPDLLFGRYNIVMGWSGPGLAEVISGQTGAVIYSYAGTYVMQNFGGLVESAGDVDGDGVPDLLIGAVGSYPFTACDGIWVYSGATGALLFRKPPTGPTDSFPWSIAGVGDVNGDGLDDVAVGDHGIRQWNNYSQIWTFGGPSGAQLFTLPGVNQIIGEGVAGPGDVDGDGFDDVLTLGAANTGYGLVQLVSGRNQSVLMALTAGGPCAALGDANGDDFPDYLVGGFPGPTGLNAVAAYSGAPPGVTAFGQGCADSSGVIPRIGCTYVPTRGSQFAINLSRVRSGAPALLVLGESSTTWNNVPLPIDLSVLSMPGCYLRVSADVSAFTWTSGPTSKGRAAIPMLIPNVPALAGATFHAQWLVLEPPGTPQLASTTRALTVTIQ